MFPRFSRGFIRMRLLQSVISSVLAASAMAEPAAVSWFRQPAQNWNEALPLGNSRLGAMLHGGANEEFLQLNECTLWGGVPHDYTRPGAAAQLPEIRRLLFAGKESEATQLADRSFMGDPPFQAAYQPLGDLRVKFTLPGKAEEYRRELDLIHGIATVRFRCGDVVFTRECFISHPDQVLVMRITASQPGSIHLNAQLASAYPHKIHSDAEGRSVLNGQWHEDGKPKPWTAIWKEPGIRYATAMQASSEGGSFSTNDGIITIQGADAVTLTLAASTSFRNFRDISGDPSADWPARLKQAKHLGYTTLRNRHVKDFSEIMGRVDIDLGGAARNAEPTDERLKAVKTGVEDPALAALYFQFGRYLLLSSSRPGSQPANLQGIWNQDGAPAWGSKYTTNINLQMNYWPAEVTNLSECGLPVHDMIDDLMITGARVAKEYYDCRGWTLHHNTDLWRGAAPVDGVWGIWPMAGAWLVRQSWERYQFTGDVEFLRKRTWPQMRGAARFILDFLVEAPAGSPVAGKLVTCPSHSPENTFVKADGSQAKFTHAATMDLMIIRDLLENCRDAAHVLGGADFEPEFRKEIDSALARLAPVQISPQTGRLQEWVEDYAETEPGHRHMSHLYALHPAHQITRATPELMAAARKSLDFRLANGGGGTGWSRAWLVNFFARLHDGAEAAKHLNLLFAESTLPNLFDNCPPFQIDGNFGGCAGVAEMLVQSHAGEIELLPALPPSWKTGSVRGLRARGGVEVDLSWQDGKPVETKVRSLTGKPIKIRHAQQQRALELKPGTSIILRGESLEAAP